MNIIFDKSGKLLNTEEIKQYKLSLHHPYIKNIDEPRTIQEKLQWLMLYDTNNILKANCADKIKVHDYCIKKLGNDICVPIIKIYNNADEIELSKLPNKFIIKCNHGYNMNIIVKDKFNINNNYKELLTNWLSIDFGLHNYQPHYSLIEHKIFIEQYLIDENQKESLYDYKFWCFNGKPKFFSINDGNGHGNINYYKMNKSIYPEIERTDYLPNYLKNYKMPNNFDLMVEYSKILSEPFKFVRIDFYEVDDKVYLGELTFTPGAGLFKYKNPDANILVGNMLKLD